MAEEIVRIIKVDTKNSGKSIKDLRNEIKSLRTELEKTEVGSEEFSAALKKLTQTQKEYNSIQEQVRDMSKTNQQNMVQFASFARNLGKAYSSLNAAIGLFASNNEDVQKSMLKVQRTIQLIQGLDGVAGLVRDLPKIIAGFKSWIQALNPLERQIDRIAKGIDGIDPSKLKAANEASRAAAGGAEETATAAAAAAELADNIKIETDAIQEQGQTIVPVNDQWDKYNQELIEAKKTMQEWRPEMSRLSDIFEEYNKHTTQGKIDMDAFNNAVSELMNGDPSKLHQFFVDSELDIDALDATAKKFGWTTDSLVEGLQNLEEGLGEDSEAIKQIQKELKAAEAASAATASGFKKLGAALKSALATVGWTLLITAIVTAAFKLWDYIKAVKTAAQEQKELNKEISQGTNQSASRQIVVLKELAAAYNKLGDSADKKQEFIQKYSDKIKETGVSIDDLKKAEDVFVNNTDKYVNAIMARAKAQAVENAAVKIYQEYLDERYDLEQKFADDKNKAAGTNTKEEYITLLQGMGMTADEAEQAWATATSKKQQKILDQIDAADKKVQERLKKMFEDVAELEKEYAGIFASATTTTTPSGSNTDWNKEYKDALEALKNYVQDYLDVFKDARTKELDDNRKAYDQNIKDINENFLKGVEAAKGNAEKLLAIEDEKNKALEFARLAFERRTQEIIKKYNDQALEDEKKHIEEQYQVLQTEIERIRRMTDTSNLRQPREQTFQTVYKGNGVMPFGIQKNWVNVYQSKEDVENQYKAQIEYNNKVYELTKQRIEQENELLKKQLEIEGLDADKRFEIERTLAENEMALSDAKLENEQANLDAYLTVQEKKKAALEGVLDVASTSLNAMASIFRTEAQIHQTESQDLTKSQEEREKAAKKMESAMQAYKAFAITQAIVDTWKSANEAYAAMASIPYVGPALGIAASAAAVISGMANVRAIMSESMTSQSQSSSVTAPSAMQAPPIEYTRNLVGDKELDEINQPIRCYVLEQDVTRVQNKVKVTETNATF